MVCPATAVPLPIRKRERVVERTADFAHLRRREVSIDRNDMRPVPVALVRDLTAEFSHRRIVHALGQLGSRKAPNTQILDAESVMVPNKPSGQLMQEVLPLVGGSLLDAGHGPALAFRFEPFLRRENVRCARLSFRWRLR